METKFKSEKEIKSNHLKNTIKAIFLCILTCVVAFYINRGTFKTYILLKYGVTTKGFVIDVTEDSTDRPKGEANFDFYYTYTFRSADGRTITGYGDDKGSVPQDLTNVNEQPFEVDILYANNDPNLNMVKNNDPGNPDNVLLRGIMGCLITLCAGFYIAYLMFIQSLNEYKAEMTILNNPGIQAYRARILKHLERN